jgi:phenylacetate-CoA ligase
MSIIRKNIIFPIADLVMKTKAMHYLKVIEDMNQWDNKDIVSWQNKQLKDLINHCYYNTVYYKNLFDKNKISPSDINSKEDLKKIPPLTKDLIKKNYEDLIPKNIKKHNYKSGQTGGSTAEPLKYFQDLKSWSYCYANGLYNWRDLGYDVGDKFLTLGSSSIIPGVKSSIKHRIYYALKGKISMSAMNLDKDSILEILKVIKQNNIQYLYGYSTALYLLAKYVRELNLEVPKIKGCISTSELLLPAYRTEVQNVFKCKILDGYGAGDGGITAFNINGDYFKVAYNCILETNQEVSSNSGLVYSTDLLNYSFPFIRYEVGDGAEISANSSYNGQIITKLLGRKPNVINLENGKILIAPGFTVLFGGLNVKAYRINKTGINELTIQVIKEKNYTNEDEEIILKSFKHHAGADCKINLTYHDSFKLSNSGKRDYFLS